MRQIHRVIRETFRMSERRVNSDHMPFLVRRGDRRTLAAMFEKLGFDRGVEVGTRKGHYAMELCTRNPRLHLTCVDPWEAYSTISQAKQDELYAEALVNLEPYKDRIDIVRMRSHDAIGKIDDRSLDFVYIDGDHTFNHVVVDIVYWSKKVKPGGIVACHDYMAGHNCGVVPAIDAFTYCNKITPWYVTREFMGTAFWVNR